MFRLEALPAHKGDCLVLLYGEAARPRIVLIDGGPNRTYEPALRPRLHALRAMHALADHEALPIEVLMVSHLDDDHINGILDMTGELRDLKSAGRPLPFEIATLWHNGFDDILGNDQIEAAAEAAEGSTVLVTASLGHDDRPALASIRQGRQLRDDARFFEWSLNSGRGDILSASASPDAPIELPGDLTFRVIGPRRTELERLQKEHDDFLREKGLGKDAPEAALAAFSDRGVANLSSLVVLAEHGGKTMLLTGDARGDHVLAGLRDQGLLPGAAESVHVDVLKVMHHGSERNVTEAFFRTVRADHYVFSGNGKHGNPERECLQMLFDARPEGDFHLHFTYPVADIDAERRDDRHVFNPPFVDETHALATFLEDARARKIPFTVHEGREDTPVAIDLA